MASPSRGDGALPVFHRRGDIAAQLLVPPTSGPWPWAAAGTGGLRVLPWLLGVPPVDPAGPCPAPLAPLTAVWAGGRGSTRGLRILALLGQILGIWVQQSTL